MQRVAMLVDNDVQHDARVQREAAALSRRYQVTVFGIDCPTLDAAHNGFEVRPVDVRTPDPARGRVAARVAYLRFVWRAVVTLRRHQPDALHAHDLNALIPCAIAAARLRVPLVYDAHELFAEQGRHGRLVQRLIRAVEDVAMVGASAVLAANESRAEVMWREYRVPVRPVAIVNCPEADSTAIVTDGRLRRWISDRGRRWTRVVVYQGFFLHDRHLVELARAARLLPADTGVVFVGDGPAGDEIRCAGDDRVLLHPLVPLDQLLTFIAGADVGVVTYANTCRNNYLCAPNKLFDYARAGLAIAVGDLPELVRVVNDFDAGVIFKNGDPDSMAAEITALLRDEAHLRRAQAGAGRLAREFTWDAEASKLLALYDHVMRPARPGR